MRQSHISNMDILNTELQHETLINFDQKKKKLTEMCFQFGQIKNMNLYPLTSGRGPRCSQDTSIPFSLHVSLCDKHCGTRSSSRYKTSDTVSVSVFVTLIHRALLQIHAAHKAKQRIFGQEKCLQTLSQSLSQSVMQTRRAPGTVARRHFTAVIDPCWHREGSI